MPSGKKGSELGDYDPLTQADSEDDSEEDDLVLNYPRNGLGRSNNIGTATSDTRSGNSSGRGGRFSPDEEEDEDDEWRERPRGKTRLDTEEGSTRQKYFSQREIGRDGAGEDAQGMHSSGSTGMGSECDLDEKKAKMVGAIRTAAFMVPLCTAMVVVLLCAFLLPCPAIGLDRRPEWERELGGDAGGDYTFLFLL